MPHEQVALVAQTQTEEERPQQVVGRVDTILVWWGVFGLDFGLMLVEIANEFGFGIVVVNGRSKRRVLKIEERRMKLGKESEDP